MEVTCGKVMQRVAVLKRSRRSVYSLKNKCLQFTKFRAPVPGSVTLTPLKWCMCSCSWSSCKNQDNSSTLHYNEESGMCGRKRMWCIHVTYRHKIQYRERNVLDPQQVKSQLLYMYQIILFKAQCTEKKLRCFMSIFFYTVKAESGQELLRLIRFFTWNLPQSSIDRWTLDSKSSVLPLHHCSTCPLHPQRERKKESCSNKHNNWTSLMDNRCSFK